MLGKTRDEGNGAMQSKAHVLILGIVQSFMRRPMHTCPHDASKVILRLGLGFGLGFGLISGFNVLFSLGVFKKKNESNMSTLEKAKKKDVTCRHVSVELLENCWLRVKPKTNKPKIDFVLSVPFDPCLITLTPWCSTLTLIFRAQQITSLFGAFIVFAGVAEGGRAGSGERENVQVGKQNQNKTIAKKKKQKQNRSTHHGHRRL